VTSTDADSPTLDSHDKVLNHVEVKVSSLNFVLNFVALRNCLQFAETFRRSLVFARTEQAASAKIQFKQKLRQVKAHLKEEHIVYLVNKAKQVGLIWE
jgi:hypothetical protein